jgi:hypothetical protein
MKILQLFSAGALLATLAAAGQSSATEVIRTSHQACRSHNASSLEANINYSILNVNDWVYCPVVRLTTSTVFSDLDLRTSDGVEVGEVSLREVDQDGDQAASYGPTTTVCSGQHCHDWNTITPAQTDTQFFIRVDGQPNDRIYSYSAADSSITLN